MTTFSLSLDFERRHYFDLLKVTWHWQDDVTSTCLISLICVSSCRCTCLSNLVVIGLMKMKISILILILTWALGQLPTRKIAWKPKPNPTIILTGGNFNRGQLSWHPYMNTSEKAELTASIRHIERFSKSGLLIYNSEVADTAGWKQEEK